MEITRIKEKKSLHTFKDSTLQFYFRGAKVANNSQPHKPHQPHRNNTTTSCSAGETWRGRLFYIVYRSLAAAWWTAVARKLPLFGYPVLLPTTCGV